jgi:hypothetical protein
MTKNFQNLGTQAAAQGADFTKTTKGGGDGAPKVPAAGPVRLRLVGYVELGLQEVVFQGVAQEKPRFKLIFELSGKNHAPRDIDGKKVPWLLEVEETLSRNEKANASKIFKALNHEGKHVHFAQMLGEAFLGEVIQRKYPRRSDDRSKSETWTGVAADLRAKGQPYTMRAPKVLDPETDELKVVKVDPPLTPLRCFLWELADKDQWDSLFIDGTYAEVKDDDGKVILPERTRNVLQEKIKKATNFSGSRIEALLSGVTPAALAAGLEAINNTEANLGGGATDDDDDDIPF